MRQVHILGFFISAISVIGGLLDIGIQYFSNGEVQWRIPLIFIGTGVGIPLIIFPFYEPVEKEPGEEYDEDDLSGMYKDDIGMFRSSSGDNGATDINYDSGDYGGGGDGGGGD